MKAEIIIRTLMGMSLITDFKMTKNTSKKIIIIFLMKIKKT